MGDEMLLCPYDASHCIHALRMPRHLLKCRKNHPSVELSVCPFNGFHEVPAPELRYHMEHCPDKTLLDKDMHFLNNQTRVKGFTELPKCRDHELCDDDDELWDSVQLQDRSNLQRSRLRTRMRHEEDTRLRLPNREGIAARLVTSLLAVEKSGSKSRLNDVDANQTGPNGLQPHPVCSGFQALNCKECSPDVCLEYRDSVHLETSSSVQLNDVSHSLSLREDQKCVSSRNMNFVNETLDESRKSDHSMSFLPTSIIPSQELKSLPSSSDQRYKLQASNYQITQFRPERTLQELNYHALVTGRGRANPSFTSKSLLDQRSVGRGVASPAQSIKLIQLAYSLGRGRGLNKILNPKQSEK